MAVSAPGSPTSHPYNSSKKPSNPGFAFCTLYKVTPAGYKD